MLIRKKTASNKSKVKQSASKKPNLNSEVTGGDVDGSYLHNVSQTTSGGEELLDMQALNAGSEATRLSNIWSE